MKSVAQSPGLVVLVALVAVGLPAGEPAQSKTSGKPWTRSVFVSVVDPSGAPVLGLGPADFEVSEGGIKREVVKAGLATTPMRIAVFADTSDGASNAVNPLRAALTAFADAIPAPHELMLISTGRQMRVRVQPTTDRKKFKDAASSLFSDGGATPLMDALIEADDRFLKKADDRWPVLVIVSSDGTEGSAGVSENRFNDWVKGLPARGIAAHAIVLKYKGGSMAEVVANHVAVTLNGSYDAINTSNSLADKLKTIADRLMQDYQVASAKYEVAFATPSTSGPVMIGVAREGVRVSTTIGRLR
ncbi:MAG TPA: hypothetical protein VH583_12560 [Vicinamibacterales bacterium]